MVDDLLDFIGTEGELGKPVGSDLDQGTLTLPAMLLLEQYPQDNPVRELFANPDMPQTERRDKIKRAINMVGSSSVEAECYKVAADYCDKARRELESLPDKPARQTLLAIADFVVSRKN